MPDRTLNYWLATSAVTFTGTVTTSTHAHGAGTKISYDADATLGTRADRVQSPVALTLEERAFAKTKATLKFTDDGRLAGTDVSSTGQGTKILAAAMTIAGTVLKTVGVFALAANLGQPAPSQDEPFPRQLLLDKLTAREDELAEALADLVVADGTADTSRQLELIDTALSSVGEQRNRLALEQAAWVAVDSTSVVSHRYVLDVAQLPTENELRAGLADGSPAKGVWGELRIMAVLPEYTPASDPHAELGQGYDAPIQDGASRSLWYRRPRPTRISIFRLDENDDIQPIRITETDVLDKHSRHFGLVLGDDGLFRDSELNVVIGGLGTPTAITTSHDSGLPDALAALAAAPKELTTGYSDAVKMQQVLAPADPQVAELDALRAEKTKLQLQADIAKLKKV